jgi:hypothetical protein
VAVIIAVAVVLAAGVVWFALRSRSERLRKRFGPEYSRVVDETGNRWRAESALHDRETRVKSLHIRALSAEDRVRFEDSWRTVQAQFIDDPNGTLVKADRLIGTVLAAEGYPVADFEQRAADISVDHPAVVENYRGGHQIALRHAEGRASTEDLRQAMVHYRILFEDLLGQREYTQTGRAL